MAQKLNRKLKTKKVRKSRKKLPKAREGKSVDPTRSTPKRAVASHNAAIDEFAVLKTPIVEQITRNLEELKRAIRSNSTPTALKIARTILDRTATPYMWMTQYGIKIAVTDMADSHLQNTICYLQRQLVAAFGSVTWLSSTKFKVEALAAMLNEAERRGLKV